MIKNIIELKGELLELVADEIFAESQNNLIEDKIWDRGILGRSCPGPKKISNNRYEIRYSAPHAIPVEFGREPGTMPPVFELERWAKRKLGLSAKEAKSASWAIAIKIKNEGTPPRRFLGNAVLKIKNKRHLDI